MEADSVTKAWSRYVPSWRKMLLKYKRDKSKPNPLEEPDPGRSARMHADQPPVLVVLGAVLVPLLCAFSGTGLRTRFGPQDAVLDPSPPAYYFRISGLSPVLFPLVPPTQRLYHPISTLSLTRSLRAPPPLFNLDFQCPDFHLSVATRDFLFWTDQFSRSLCLAPFLFPRRNFPMSIPPS